MTVCASALGAAEQQPEGFAYWSGAVSNFCLHPAEQKE
jgi:hypothetical protein